MMWLKEECIKATDVSSSPCGLYCPSPCEDIAAHGGEVPEALSLLLHLCEHPQSKIDVFLEAILLYNFFFF